MLAIASDLMHDSCVVLLGLAVMDVDGQRVPGMAPALFVVGAERRRAAGG